MGLFAVLSVVIAVPTLWLCLRLLDMDVREQGSYASGRWVAVSMLLVATYIILIWHLGKALL